MLIINNVIIIMTIINPCPILTLVISPSSIMLLCYQCSNIRTRICQNWCEPRSLMKSDKVKHTFTDFATTMMPDAFTFICSNCLGFRTMSYELVWNIYPDYLNCKFNIYLLPVLQLNWLYSLYPFFCGSFSRVSCILGWQWWFSRKQRNKHLRG